MSVVPPIPIRVLLFARYAELLGSDQLDLRLRSGATVGSAVAAVRALPGGESLPAQLLIARNLEQVRTDAPLTAGDELAFLPPMSGG